MWRSSVLSVTKHTGFCVLFTNSCRKICDRHRWGRFYTRDNKIRSTAYKNRPSRDPNCRGIRQVRRAKRGMEFDADGGNPGWRGNTIPSDQRLSSTHIAHRSRPPRSRIVGVLVSHFCIFGVASAGLLQATPYRQRPHRKQPTNRNDAGIHQYWCQWFGEPRPKLTEQ